jgi:hypothetical protein
MVKLPENIEGLRDVLRELRAEGKVLLAYLFGSYARGEENARSDIDLAVYLNTKNEDETIEAVDRILMSADAQIGLLRLDDEDESPFIVQEALKGIPLAEPDRDTYYAVADRVLHEAESIRFRKAVKA